MGLYNMIAGTNPAAKIILVLLDLQPSDFGRFRDAWINKGGETVTVLTRCGGGNREEYQDVFDAMSEHPLYISSADDEYDSTYAHFHFRVPDDFVELVKEHAPTEDQPTLREKFERAIEAIKAS